MFLRLTISAAPAAISAALVALCLSGPALAQQATVYDKSQDTRLDELAKQLAALTTRLTTSEKKLDDIDRRIDLLTTNVEKLTEVTADVDSRLKTLSEKVSEL